MVAKSAKPARKAAPKTPTPKQRNPLQLGKSVFIRTLSMNYTGRIIGEDAGCLLLEDAAWIAVGGRFGDMLANGTLDEVEPYPGVVAVNSSHILDVTEWTHALPRTAR
jgi:hypothetical protein